MEPILACTFLAGAIVGPGAGSTIELEVDPMVVDFSIESAAGHSPVLGAPSVLYKT